MLSSRLFISILLVAFPLLVRAEDALPIGTATDSVFGDTSLALRGYGKLKLTRGDNQWTFAATSPVNAATTVGKFLADLNLSPGVTVAPLDVNGLTYQMTVVPGGLSYTGYVTGSTGHVVAAKDQGALQTLLGSVPKGAMTNLVYPTYLDRFDRHGWGFYGFDSNFAPKGKEGNNTDAMEDLQWIAKNNMRFELWPQPTEFDDSYSIPIQRDFGWLLTEAQKNNVPVSARLYGRLPHAKELTDAFELPRTFLEGGWYWGTLDWRVNHRQSFFDKKARLYMARQAMDEIKLNGNHPEIESWMMPYGEIGGSDTWYDRHGDVSPSAVEDWHDRIQNKLHLSLAELSKMFGREDKPFKSYDEVPIPEVATFAGLPGEISDLEGDWYVKQEANKGDGEKSQWFSADLTSGWDKLHMPGSVFWFKYNVGNRELPKWTARDFDYDPATAGGKPVYLYDFARATVNDPRNIMPVYLNGQKVGDVATWTAWDVSKLLKPGKNRIAFECEVFTGRVFLSTDKPALYPYLGYERNKLWVEFNNWLLASKTDTVNIALAGMRSVEPNKPIKIMAPADNDNDDWLDTASKYGAWGHFTGEGSWAFYWYKRYGFLYGLPGTSEGAGPVSDAAGQYQVALRIFLEGLNGHDTVFSVQNVTGLPDVKKWFDDHMAVVKQMGRYDISGPQVIQYRSTNQVTTMLPPPEPNFGSDSHQLQSIWNWDFGRGTFQEIGQSGLYVDNGGIASHKIDRYKIMLDAGNEMVTPEAMKNIGDWVKNGGTYITLPFTGRSTIAAPDSWPIQELTGCQVGKLRTPGAAGATVTIGKDQPIFKEIAGQSFPDAGSSKDWQNQEYNTLSTELKAGPDCTVLATYEDGAPAIVLHKMGKGQVIALGSVFFRDVMDVNGLWLSGEREETFLRDLLNGLGQPSVNHTSVLKVVTQRYRTQNGLDDVVVMENFTGADATVDLNVTLDQPPSKVYQAAMNEIKEVPFTAKGNEITVSQVAIPRNEVQVFYCRAHDAGDAVTHWWQYQNKLWKPTDPEKIDLSSIDSGRWVDPTVDLKQNWYWTQADQAGDTWTKEGGAFTGAGEKPQPWVLDIFTAVGADTTKPLFARHTFQVKSAWLHDGGKTTLRAQGQFFDFTTWGTRSQIWVNGELVKANPEDVSAHLKPGDNVVAVRLDPQNGCQYLGVQGSIYLSHAQLPAKVVDLSGQWTNDINGTGAPVTFPGKADAFAPSRLVDIPAEWKDRYIVCYYAQGDGGSAVGAIVNENCTIAKRTSGPETEVDITQYLKFGQKNMISMLSTGGDQLDPIHHWDVSKVELHLYPRSEYRN